MERWQSGRMRLPRKQLSCVNGIGGSNPPLSLLRQGFVRQAFFKGISDLDREAGEVSPS